MKIRVRTKNLYELGVDVFWKDLPWCWEIKFSRAHKFLGMTFWGPFHLYWRGLSTENFVSIMRMLKKKHEVYLYDKITGWYKYEEPKEEGNDGRGADQESDKGDDGNVSYSVDDPRKDGRYNRQ